MEFRENKNGVHLMASDSGGEYALCGDAWDGESHLDGHGVMVETKKTKVTCRRCLAQIRNVKEYLKAKWHGKHE